MAGRHAGAFWTAVALATAAFIGGGVVAYLGYEQTAGPDGAVRGYFAALRRSDAPAALGFGDVPSGSRALLTSTVLREQQRIAPISEVQITHVARHGSTADVTVRYDLDFPSNRLNVQDTITVLHRGGSWHLARVAANTRLDMLQARDRATIVGNAIPDGPVLVFAGAAPIRVDSPYLVVDPDTSIVSLSSGDDTTIGVVVSDAGRAAARAALGSALRACLTQGAKADPRCPLPTARSVPGTVRATLPSDAMGSIGVVVLADPTGNLQLTGVIKMSGAYSALSFDNVASTHRGAIKLQVSARAFPRAPIVIQWQQVTP